MTKVILLLVSIVFLTGMSRNSPPQEYYTVCTQKKLISSNPVIYKCIEYTQVKNKAYKEN